MAYKITTVDFLKLRLIQHPFPYQKIIFRYQNDSVENLIKDNKVFNGITSVIKLCTRLRFLK